LSNTIWRTTAMLGATAVAWTAFVGTNATAQPTAAPGRHIAAPMPTGDNGPADSSPADNGPADNGTVKVHRTTTSPADPRNEPHVCAFYLVGFNFDAGQQVTWRIIAWPPTGDRKTVARTGTLVLDANGHGRTADLSLPDGHYKLYWNFVGENGRAKHKVFWVECQTPTSPPHTPPASTPAPSSTPTSTSTPTAGPTESNSPSATPSHTPSEGAGQGGPTSPPPAQEAQPVKSSGNLPFTGFAGRLLAALGAALVIGGAAAIFIARYRRGRHASTSS
jgi:hypothetical protein